MADNVCDDHNVDTELSSEQEITLHYPSKLYGLFGLINVRDGISSSTKSLVYF